MTITTITNGRRRRCRLQGKVPSKEKAEIKVKLKLMSTLFRINSNFCLGFRNARSPEQQQLEVFRFSVITL